MRAILLGTKHTTILDRREPAIFQALRCTPGVIKVEPGPIAHTGPTQMRLRLRPGISATIFVGSLFIGAGKQQCLICIRPEITVEALIRNLREKLDNFQIRVEIIGGDREMQTEQQGLSQPQLPDMTFEEKWAWCQLIYESVRDFKQLSEEEIILELQLEEIRGKKTQVQSSALEILAQTVNL